MRKKVKCTFPKLVKEILLTDINYFGIKMETLCNLIIKELGYEQNIRVHDWLVEEPKVIISFNLNDMNSRYFNNMLTESDEKIEAEFFRRVLSTYVNLHSSVREQVIKKNLFNEMQIAKKKKLEVKLAIKDRVLDVYILDILRDLDKGYNRLKIKHKESIELHEVREITLLKIY